MIDAAEEPKPGPAMKSPEQRARDWWWLMISDENGDRGVRAQLRRCKTPREALSIPAAIGLTQRLGRIPGASAPKWEQQAFERALGLAVVLASVRRDGKKTLMQALGWGKFPYDRKEADAGAERPALSELRFKRFLQTEGEEELISAFVRLLALAGEEINVADLTRTYLHFDDDRTKQRLALEYFSARRDGLDLSSPLEPL